MSYNSTDWRHQRVCGEEDVVCGWGGCGISTPSRTHLMAHISQHIICPGRYRLFPTLHHACNLSEACVNVGCTMSCVMTHTV